MLLISLTFVPTRAHQPFTARQKKKRQHNLNISMFHVGSRFHRQTSIDQIPSGARWEVVLRWPAAFVSFTVIDAIYRSTDWESRNSTTGAPQNCNSGTYGKPKTCPIPVHSKRLLFFLFLTVNKWWFLHNKICRNSISLCETKRELNAECDPAFSESLYKQTTISWIAYRMAVSIPAL